MSWNNYSKTAGPKFRLGVVLFTPGIHQLVEGGNIDVLPLIHRHVQGDWGDMDGQADQRRCTTHRFPFVLCLPSAATLPRVGHHRGRPQHDHAAVA